MPSKSYAIRSLDEFDDDGAPLWWSNEDGWVDIGSSTRFLEEELSALHLPLGNCEWVVVDYGVPA
jgi:hypothetical protein